MIKNYPLEKGEYYEDAFEKDILIIHHTAGSHRPDYTVQSWEHDKNKQGGVLPVGTAYVVGGIGSDGNTAYDGQIYKTFEDKYWAHHLGLKQVNNVDLNRRSIGIEICNWGPLTKTKDCKFLNYVGREVPENQSYKLDTPFKGHIYLHRYTDLQLANLRWLLKDIEARHPKIDLKKGMQELITQNKFAFDLNASACQGASGLWTHVNYRQDKSDCSPYPQLIELIKSL